MILSSSFGLIDRRKGANTHKYCDLQLPFELTGVEFKICAIVIYRNQYLHNYYVKCTIKRDLSIIIGFSAKQT